VHNIALVDVDGRTELSLHVKLPGELPLEEAHAIAEQLERAVCRAVPEIAGVQTHLEPLTETSPAREVDEDTASVAAIVRETTGSEPRELRVLRTQEGRLVAYLTLGVGGGSLEQAHRRASEVEERIRRDRPEIADVIVHTEP